MFLCVLLLVVGLIFIGVFLYSAIKIVAEIENENNDKS